jgi:hypothetical protein
VKQCAIPDFGV